MQLYTISENGALRKANKMEFIQNRVYLIDDIKTIYLWFGLRASNKKKDFSIKKAKILNKKRNNKGNIQIINQNKEYGSFLAIMDILKEGFKSDRSIERRPELEIEVDDTLELIEAGLDPDFEGEITIAAHKLAEEKKPYEDLCKQLAELQLMILKEKKSPTLKEIKEKAEIIYKSSSTYEEICWLIAELSRLLEKKVFK
ncbi:MAG: hypothetical protein ACTSQJ_12145 [Promethearchaeota archaeon]